MTPSSGSGHEPERVVSQGDCICRKRQYGSKSEARWIAAQIRKQRGEHVVAFHCPFDRRLWHVDRGGTRLPLTRAQLRAAIHRAFARGGRP